MAKPALPKKAKTIRIWLWVIILLFVGMFFTMKYTIMGKANIINSMVENCVQNVPAHPQWQQDLQKLGFTGNTDWVPQAYCECTLVPIFEPMAETEIRQFSKLSPEERMSKMGGSQGFQQRHEQCLKQIQKSWISLLNSMPRNGHFFCLIETAAFIALANHTLEHDT